MIKKLLKIISGPIRQFLGLKLILTQEFKTQSLLRELRMMQIKQDHLLKQAISYTEYYQLDKERLKTSDKYRRFHQLIGLLSPMDIRKANYRRVGRDYDGGYVMLDDFSASNVDAAYSFGISDDVSWDESMADLGIDIYMYDHTISALPKNHPRFHFTRKGVTGHLASSDLETLSTLIMQNGHQDSDKLLLKMDIEGNEWDVFDETPSEIINQFSQITIELHGLIPDPYRGEIGKIISVLDKINQTHQSVHVHANGSCEVDWLGDTALPSLLEVTYIRRSSYQDRFIPNKRTFPTEIDQPTQEWLPEVPLGTFSVATWDQPGTSKQQD